MKPHTDRSGITNMLLFQKGNPDHHFSSRLTLSSAVFKYSHSNAGSSRSDSQTRRDAVFVFPPCVCLGHSYSFLSRIHNWAGWGWLSVLSVEPGVSGWSRDTCSLTGLEAWAGTEGFIIQKQTWVWWISLLLFGFDRMKDSSQSPPLLLRLHVTNLNSPLIT